MDILPKLLKVARITSLGLALLGVSSIAFELWLLDRVIDNGYGILEAKLELTKLVSDTELKLSKDISEVLSRVEQLRLALGESPDAIRRAAIEIENSASTIAELEKSAIQIQRLDNALKTIRSDIDKIENDIRSILEILEDEKYKGRNN